MPSTPKDLADDLAACEAATPGPWDSVVVFGTVDYAVLMNSTIKAIFDNQGYAYAQDADFCERARTRFPVVVRELIEAKAEIDRLQIDNSNMRQRLRDADIMAAAIDYDVHAGLLATRTRITDKRELYGDPFSPGEAQRLLRMEDHPHALRESMTHWHCEQSETIRQQAREIDRLRERIAELERKDGAE